MSDVRRTESAWFTEWTPEAMPRDDEPPPAPRTRRRSRAALKWVNALTMVVVLGTAGRC